MVHHLQKDCTTQPRNSLTLDPRDQKTGTRTHKIRITPTTKKNQNENDIQNGSEQNVEEHKKLNKERQQSKPKGHRCPVPGSCK